MSERTDTKIVHGGRRKEWLRGMVNVPVSRTSTVIFDSVADLRAGYPPQDGRLSYGRNGTWTQWSLAEALTELEPRAAGTSLVASGATAVYMALLSVLGPGDELLMVDSAYAPTRIFCDKELKRLGITTRYYDPVATAVAIDAMIGDKTRAIFMESPGSLTFEVQDVPGICAVAKERGVSTLLDNTWATSLFFPAIEKGVDLSVVACTKYISGHSDVMMGAITAAPSHWERLQRTIRRYGQYVSPDDAYLVARGLRTLAVRLRAHQANALKVANWLKEQSKVATVLHPAFEECPGHETWKRDFTGSSGLFSFALKGTDCAARDAAIDRLKLFAVGQSWGGYESLATTADTDGIRTAKKRDFGGALIRLNVGLEDPEDLIEDLAQALGA